MRIKSIKFKVVFVIILSLLVGGTAIAILLNNSFEKNIKLIAGQSIEMSKENFNNLRQNDTNMLSATVEALLLDKTMINLFMQKDRKKLYDYTAPLFKNLKERYGITHFYFINPEPDQKCFLRVHMPEKYGDVIKRSTYLKSVKTKSFGTGMEVGKTAFALRAVYPIRNEGKVVGYIELGEEIGHFLKYMKKQTGNDFGLLIDKKHLDKKEWGSVRKIAGLRDNWGDMQDVVLVDKTTNDTHLLKFKGEVEDVPRNGEVLEKTKKGDSIFIRGIFPVQDASGKIVGGVFVLRNMTPMFKEMTATQTKAVIYIAILMVVISLIIILMINKLVFARLRKITDVATRVVGGDYTTQIVPEKDDEVGEFETLLEQFRTLFVGVLEELEKKE